MAVTLRVVEGLIDDVPHSRSCQRQPGLRVHHLVVANLGRTVGVPQGPGGRSLQQVRQVIRAVERLGDMQ